MKKANLVSAWGGAWLLGVVLVVLVGCGGEQPGAPEAIYGPEHRFGLQVGERTVSVQLALAPAEMQRGLMGRRELGPEEGMLFVYDWPQQLSFWMRNTPLALDIGFFDAAGVLREIYPLEPFDEKAVRSRRDDLLYALEMNQGWFAARGVRPGARLDLPALAAAVESRGVPLAAYPRLRDASGAAAR
jgi:uncharacterized membrane protein (UPF0127 family)